MKYYLLSNSTDEKVVGPEYPQCKGLPSGIGLTYKWFDKPTSMTKLRNEDFPEFEPELIFELEEKAILTDIVSPSNISARGLLISHKAKNIFNQFNIIEHKYYPSTLIVNGERLNYFWLHFKENTDYFLNCIDFKNSSFYIGNLARLKESQTEIETISDYYKVKKALGFKTLNFEKLSFLTKIEFDLYYINNFHNDFIISNELAKTLQTLRITGIEIQEPKFIIF